MRVGEEPGRIGGKDGGCGRKEPLEASTACLSGRGRAPLHQNTDDRIDKASLGVEIAH